MDLADDSLPLEQRMEKAGINVNRYKRYDNLHEIGRIWSTDELKEN